jgi:hypothetical protein
MGALSKQGIQNRLIRLNALRQKSLDAASTDSRPKKAAKLRCGAIQQAVLGVLESANQSMAVPDIHAAVEDRLKREVSKNSVYWCLSTGVKGTSPRIERVATGFYRLRRKAA